MWSVDLLGSLASNMNQSEKYEEQRHIKNVKAYFSTKLAVMTQRQCIRDFGKNKLPDRRTAECLVAIFRETESLTNENGGRSG